jgi:molybdopterin converting factor subunit 1
MTRSKTIQLQYFASLREKRGRSEEAITTKAATAEQLYDELVEQHDLDQPKSSLRVAINDEFCEWDRELEPDDRVVFIPPVSGG